MKTFDSCKVYDNHGYLTQSGVKVTISDDVVQVAAAQHPRHEVYVNFVAGTVTSDNGWEVRFDPSQHQEWCEVEQAFQDARDR